ncbi:MAG: TerC family protein [Planctomycetes bacterium]|nr:TerC family protein [Planctomycetota bacterium]MCB9903532.1 TerC family protein [Planctomycetota bacterium]
MAELLTLENFVALLALALLEIVLGIDNIVFLTIVTGKLPEEQQPRARRIGLLLAMGMRILLLCVVGWVIGLTEPLFGVLGQEISGRDMILLGGGLFLIGKATFEIHEKLEEAGHEHQVVVRRAAHGLAAVLVQVVALDLIFSLDSVITAVGMAKHLAVMIAAVVAAVGVMILFAEPVSRFVQKHPTTQMLALSFLILIGVMLVAEGFGQEIDKGYVYFAMAFSLVVEILNLRLRKGRNAVPSPDAPSD